MRVLLKHPLYAACMAVLVPLPATATPCAEADPPDPGCTVTVNLDAQRITETLPFDIDFTLEASVKPETFEGRVDYQYFRSAPNCPDITYPGSWRTATVVGSGAARKMRVGLSGLPPNYHFCFLFEITRHLEEAERKRLLAEAATAVDLELRQVQDISSLAATASFKRFREQLIASVESELGPNEHLVFIGPNAARFFDPAVTRPTDLAAGPRITFKRMVEAQKGRDERIKDLANAVDGATAALSSLRDDKDYAKLVAKLAAAKAEMPMAARILDNNPLLLSLWTLSDPQLSVVVQGGGPSSVEVPDFYTIWKPAELQPYAERVAALRASLQGVQDVVAELLTSPQMRQLTGLANMASSPLGNVNSKVDAAVQAMQAVHAAMQGLQERLYERSDGIAALLAGIETDATDSIGVSGSTVGSFQTGAMWYVSMDLGAGVAPEVDELFTYTAASVYLRPVNKKQELKGWRGEEFLKRFSFLVGLTVTDLKNDDDGTLQPLVLSRQLVVGAGLRLNKYLRFSAGALVFKDRDPSPLVDDETLAVTPFASFSLDVDIARMFRDRFKAARGTQTINTTNSPAPSGGGQDKN